MLALELAVAIVAAWALWAWATRASIVSSVLAVLLVGYVLGFDLWHAHAGPLPLTLDRLLLLVVAAAFAWSAYRGRVAPTRPTGVDWAIALVLVWLTGSCLVSRPPEDVHLPTSPNFRLLVSFWIPAALYALLRHERFDERLARRLLTGLAGLGLYLSATAVLETVHAWSLVFPRYIADPALGLHYGRARGPGLNSVSLGVYLGVCTSATWLLLPRASRAMRLFWFAATALGTLAVLLTYTRSTWIGLALAIVVVLSMQAPRGWRLASFLGATTLGLVLLVVGKDALVGLEREDRGDVSAHSVQQRAAFLYVSMRMFRDHPLWGVGFGRFYDQKMPYLTDRRQSFELESIRPLHHHNTLLSLLTETGMVGLAAYLAVLVGFGRVGWGLARDEALPAEQRRLGLLALATLSVYLPSAVFHDLTLVHSDQWLLFTVGGAATGCWMNAPRSLGAAAAAAPARAALAPFALADRRRPAPL